MWSLLGRNTQLTIIVATGICLAWGYDAAYEFFTGQMPNNVKLISLFVFVIGVLFAGIAEIAWRPLWRRYPLLQLKTFPDLNGTWNGTLTSTWVDPATGSHKPPVAADIIIRQGLFTTSVSLKTGESVSHSTRSFLEPFRDTGRFRIWYSYNNDPQAQFQHRSSPHEGVAFLECEFDADPNRLSGRYYTDRRTTGDIDARREKRRGRR
jgi:SMODS-associating 2TM, beta-strand rich effector domain